MQHTKKTCNHEADRKISESCTSSSRGHRCFPLQTLHVCKNGMHLLQKHGRAGKFVDPPSDSKNRFHTLPGFVHPGKLQKERKGKLKRSGNNGNV